MLTFVWHSQIPPSWRSAQMPNHHQMREVRFAAVPEHPSWQACTDGHIYSADGMRISEHRKEVGENRLRVNCAVHHYHDAARLIAEAFWGSRTSGMSVVHKDSNTADNRLENLMLMVEAGSNSACGRRQKLSRSKKRELHRQLDLGIPKTHIAATLGISPRCVRHHHNSCRCAFQDSRSLRVTPCSTF